MTKKRRRFKRPTGQRPYRRLFLIATEGYKTEPQYFQSFNTRDALIRVKCLKEKNKSAPEQVLERMKDRIQQERLKKSDEAWLVVDKDQWTPEQLSQLQQWSQQATNYGLAVSNPKFELWLLLHFEDARGISSSRDCSERLARYLPEYGKGHVETEKLKSRVKEAIQRAKGKDTSNCRHWPQNTGTTVYCLVERMLASPSQAP